MTDTLEQDIARASRAERLLNDDLLTGAFDTLRTEYLAMWEATGARDTDARERLWQAVQVLGKVRSNLQSAVNSGTLARAQVAEVAGLEPKRFGIV